MDTRRLNYFIEIVERGSITGAARSLGVAQPALSQQLAVLEHQVKATLMRRTRFGVVPTSAGMRLYESAKRIVRDVASLERELRNDGRCGVVTVGLVPSVLSILGLPFLKGILRAQPQLLPQIVEGPAYALREQLERGLLDVAVLPSSLLSRELETAEVFTDQLQIVAAKSRAIDIGSQAGLAAMPWLVTRAPNPARNALSAWFARHGLEPNVVAEINSQQLVIEAVQADLGIGLISSLSFRPCQLPAEIQMLPFPGWLEPRTYFACWRRGGSAEQPSCIAVLERIGREIMAQSEAL